MGLKIESAAGLDSTVKRDIVGANNFVTGASARIEDPNFGSIQSPRLALGRALYVAGDHRL
jgi:hypothetical protein